MIVAFGKWWVKWLVLADFFVSCLTLGLSFDMSWLRERRNSSTEKEISIGQLQVRSLVLRQNALESDRCFFLKRVSLGQSNGFPSSSHVICCFPVDGMGETAGESPQKNHGFLLGGVSCCSLSHPIYGSSQENVLLW